MYNIPKTYKTWVTIKRYAYHQNFTIGDYHVENEKICNSLEDKVRDYNQDGDLLDEGETKVYGETAIPYTPTGKCYLAWIENHRKFGLCLRIFGVPHFEGILSHTGIKPSHTLGCILAGEYTLTGELKDSRKNLNKIINKLRKKVDIGEKFPFFVIDKR